MSGIPQLEPKHIFGVKADVKNSFLFRQEEGNVVYAVGDLVVSYAMDQKKQFFAQSADKTLGITAMSITPGQKRYLAVAEKSDRGVISVYDSMTLRRRRVLATPPETSCTEYVSLCFSPDSKYLVALSGGPDWKIICWLWDKMKVVCIGDCKPSNPAARLNQVSFWPGGSNDVQQICVTGDGFFRLVKMQEGAPKPLLQSIGKREPQNYLCHEWLSEERLLVGTDTGEIILIESGDFRMVLPQSPTNEGPIDCIQAYSKGFVVGAANGDVYLFEKSDEPRELYRRSRVVKVLQNASRIKSIAISPQEDTVVCVQENSQIYKLSINSNDSLKDEMVFEPMFQTFHAGPVTGMDMCIRKQLIATCGLDKTVRIWNYSDWTLEQSMTFTEEIYSIAFHPSGHHVLVGFADKLKLMNLLIDDIRPFKEFGIKQCRECRFSHGGQFFAAVNGNTIQIFNHYTFDNIGNLRGHNSKVTSLYWSPDDTRLISAGAEGAVYRWRLSDLKRDDESVVKGCSYTSAICSPDYKTTIACGTDKKLKVISENMVQVAYENPICLTQLALSHSGKCFFAGTENGTLRAYKFPLTGDFVEYTCHAAAVSRIAISFDDALLISTGLDGTLCVFEIKNKDSLVKGREKELTFSQEVLVTKSDLEEKMAKVTELANKVDELTMQNEYAIKLKDIGFAEEKKSLDERFRTEVDQQKIKYDILLQEKNDKEIEMSEKLRQIEERHQLKLQEVDTNYQKKLMAEVEKYRQLYNEKEDDGRKFRENVQDLNELHEKMVHEMTDDYENRISEEQQYIEQLTEEKNDLTREFEETKRQLEEDADMEIEELKNEYERKLYASKDEASKVKTQSVLQLKEIKKLKEEILTKDDTIGRLNAEGKQLGTVIVNLEKDIAGLKKEIKERDETIGDKEKRIFELKKKNQELEKFKFVLDYKIKELKRQIEPKELKIADMTEQIKDMDADLVRYHKTKSNLELQISDLKMKLEGLQHEVAAERTKVQDLEALIRRMRTDVHEAVQYIQDPKALKEAIRSLYQKHVSVTIAEQGVDVDIQREYARQREYLERSVSSLKTKLTKETDRHKKDSVRIMQENVALIREVNDLRKEIKSMKLAQRQKEVFGKPKKEGELDDPTWPPEALREIEIQREEMARLRARIDDLESSTTVSKRPISRERLPPMEGFHEDDGLGHDQDDQ